MTVPAWRDDTVAETIHGRIVRDPYRALEDRADGRVRAWWRDRVDEGRRTLAGLPERERCAELIAAVPDAASASMLCLADRATAWLQSDGSGLEQVAVLPDEPTGEVWIAYRAAVGAVSSLSAAPTSRHLCWIADGRVHLADLATRTVRGLPLAGRPVRAAVVAAARIVVIVADDDGLRPLVLEGDSWQVTAGPPIAVDGEVAGLAVAPSGRRFCLACRKPPFADTALIVLDGDGNAVRRSPVLPGLVDVAFADDETLVLRTDIGAADFRVVTTTVDDLEPDQWHSTVDWPGEVLGAVARSGGRWFATADRDGASRLYELGESTRTEVRLPLRPALLTALAGSPDGRLAVVAESLCHPATLFLRTSPDGPVRQRDIAGQPVGGLELSTVEADGVPVALLRRKDLEGRPAPTLVTLYGGFGIPQDLGYSAIACAWALVGGTFVIAGVRGGGERGRRWHRAGARRHKYRAVEDLLAVSRWLVAQGVADSLGLFGGSNGGLLAAAAMTQAPELYRAVVCGAPLLDMVRYERFGIGGSWRDEYGSASDAADFESLLSYSPYHHVDPAAAYPAVLFALFEDDAVVDPVHAMKMYAALSDVERADGRERRPVLVQVTPRGWGHGSRPVDRAVDLLSFFVHELRPGEFRCGS